MKKVLQIVCVAAAALLALASCKKEDASSILLAMSYDSAFTDNQAVLQFNLSRSAKSDITVWLNAREASAQGKTAVPASSLTFPSRLVINAGSTAASVDVQLAEGAVGEQAVIEVAGVSGATLSGAATAYILTGGTAPDPDFGGNQNKSWVAEYLGRYQETAREEAAPHHPVLPQKGARFPRKAARGVVAKAVTPSLQSGWTVTITGTELEYDEQGYAYYTVDVTAPGSTYIFVDTYTDAELDEYYEGDIAAMLEDYAGIEDGSTVEDSFYTAEETVSVQYYDAGATKFYIMDFDTNGAPTGKYGVVELTLPAFGGSGEGGGDDDQDSGLYDRIAVNGFSAGAYFSFDIFDPGSLTASTLSQSISDIQGYVTEEYEFYKSYYESLGVDVDFELTDFMCDSEYNYYDYEALELGEYDVLIVGLRADGTLTGEYNVSRIKVDGHSLSAAALAQKARRALPLTRK